jgi:hypothetical protein
MREILNKKSQINSKQEIPNKFKGLILENIGVLSYFTISIFEFIWDFLFRIYLGFFVLNFNLRNGKHL